MGTRPCLRVMREYKRKTQAEKEGKDMESEEISDVTDVEMLDMETALKRKREVAEEQTPEKPQVRKEK